MSNCQYSHANADHRCRSWQYVGRKAPQHRHLAYIFCQIASTSACLARLTFARWPKKSDLGRLPLFDLDLLVQSFACQRGL